MKRVDLLLIGTAAALLAGCGVGAPDYPEFSQASYRIEGVASAANGGAPTPTVIYRDGPLMRVEATIANYGEAAVVFDRSTNAAYVLTTAQTPVPQSTVADPAPTTPPQAQTPLTQTPTTPSEMQESSIAGGVQTAPSAPAPSGVAVRLADADAPQPMETAWAALGEDNARSVGDCTVAGETGHEWTPREAGSGVERVACITEDGIVLRVTENGAALWEASSVQRGAQDAALFGVPADYQIVDPQAVAEGVSENMEQLDSVTGAPAPQ